MYHGEDEGLSLLRKISLSYSSEAHATWQKESSRLSCRKDFSLPQNVAGHARMQCTKLLASITNALSVRMISCWTTVGSFQYPGFKHTIPPPSCQQQLDAVNKIATGVTHLSSDKELSDALDQHKSGCDNFQKVSSSSWNGRRGKAAVI